MDGLFQRTRRYFHRRLTAGLPGIWDRYSGDAFQLAQAIDAAPAILNLSQQHPDRVAKARTQRICNWYIPPFDNPFYGGMMTILRCAEYLGRVAGMSQRFLVCGTADPTEVHNKIKAAFPSLESAEILILDTPASITNIPASDYSFATLWTTAYVVLNVQNTGLKFYFAQDFEPLFYPAGSTYAQCEQTYSFGFHAICNTPGVQRSIEAIVPGISATHFTPRLDSKVFYYTDDRARPRDRKRLFFYGRPGHPRNAFELGASALLRLKARMGDNLEIVAAGDAWPEHAKTLEGVVQCLGVLPYADTADLYRSCHAGLAFMMTRHPSYLPFELMACGAVVISNRNPANTWFMRDQENCLIAPATATGIADTIEHALNNWTGMGEIRRNALEAVSTAAGGSWDAEFARVLGFIETCSEPAVNPVAPAPIPEQAEKRTECIGKAAMEPTPAKKTIVAAPQARPTAAKPKIEGLVVQCESTGEVFFARNGMKHYLPDVRWLAENGFAWPSDVQKVAASVIAAYPTGRPISASYTPEQWRSPPRRSSIEMRAIAASQLRGRGVEIGAGSSPMAVPLDCDVLYADMFTTEELHQLAYPGQRKSDIVPVSLKATLDDMDGIADADIDFLVACHVIEHTTNPIGAIVNGYRKLRPGGKMVLVVPDKERTFDSKRPLTTLEHLLEDFNDPSRKRDYQHFVEFYRLAFNVPEQELEQVAKEKFAERFPIHFHTWNYPSFLEMVLHIQQHIVPWRDIWSQPTLDHPEHDIEFYFCLTK